MIYRHCESRVVMIVELIIYFTVKYSNDNTPHAKKKKNHLHNIQYAIRGKKTMLCIISYLLVCYSVPYSKCYIKSFVALSLSNHVCHLLFILLLTVSRHCLNHILLLQLALLYHYKLSFVFNCLFFYSNNLSEINAFVNSLFLIKLFGK